MKDICTILLQLLRNESGQDLIEYALVAALIGLATIAALQTLSGSVSASPVVSARSTLPLASISRSRPQG